MINLITFLRALPSIAPITEAAFDVGTLLNEMIDSIEEPADQETARAALKDLAAENDAGHARYQAKLAEAALAHLPVNPVHQSL